MHFTAGNQALYVQTPRENSHESLPTTPDLNLILCISSPELAKVQIFPNYKRCKHWKAVLYQNTKYYYYSTQEMY